MKFNSCGQQNSWEIIPPKVFCVPSGSTTLCSLAGGARDEHHRVKFGDFKIKIEDGPQGKEYVEWSTERGSKTRTGKHQFVPDRSFNPKMYATAGPRCPVKLFRGYLARRPPEMNSEDCPFYLAAITNPASII